MDKLSSEEIKAIKADAEKNHDGNLDLAIVEHLGMAHAAARSGGRVPAFLEPEVAEIRKQLTTTGKAAASPIKTTPPAKTIPKKRVRTR